MLLVERLEAARVLALNGGVPMRRTDGALYALLGECLSICEEVQREGLQRELSEAVRVRVDVRGQANAGKGRRYLNKNADVSVVVCRYVLQGQDNRNSFYRYATALRTAQNLQIKGQDLAMWLKANGGVVQLERSKQVSIRPHMRNNFHLRKAVLVPGGEPFTVTLQLTSEGDFVVLELKTGLAI